MSKFLLWFIIHLSINNKQSSFSCHQQAHSLLNLAMTCGILLTEERTVYKLQEENEAYIQGQSCWLSADALSRAKYNTLHKTDNFEPAKNVKMWVYKIWPHEIHCISLH